MGLQDQAFCATCGIPLYGLNSFDAGEYGKICQYCFKEQNKNHELPYADKDFYCLDPTGHKYKDVGLNLAQCRVCGHVITDFD